MSDNFDPYHIWLGIPPKEQPPNHYRLLGLVRGEENAEVIDAAANRQTAYLHDMASGPHRRECQKVLNEIAAARRLLLDPRRKKKYDAKLDESKPEDGHLATPESTSSAKPSVDEPPVVPAPMIVTDEAPITAVGRTEEKPKPATANPQVWIWGGTGVATLLTLVVFIAAWPRDNSGTNERVASSEVEASISDTDERETGKPEKDDGNRSDDDSLETTDSEPDHPPTDPLTMGTPGEGSGTEANVKPMAPMNPAKVVPPPSKPVKLVGHWTFDTKKNSVVAKSPTKLKATLAEKPTMVEGPAGPAAVLGGRGASLTLPKEAFNVKSGTLAFWVRPALEEGPEPIFVPSGFPLSITRDPESRLVVRSASSAVGGVVRGGHWHHIAVTWVSKGTATVFLDGEPLDTKPKVGTLKAPAAARFGEFIGTPKLGPTKPTKAAYPTAVADIRLYQGEISPEAVRKLYAAAKIPEPVPPRRTKPVYASARLPPGTQGRVLREVWTEFRGKSNTDLRTRIQKGGERQVSFLKDLTFTENKGGAQDFYGQRVSGYLVPPQTGFYEFNVSGTATPGLYVGRNDSPKSVEYHRPGVRRYLRKGRLYWFEVLHRAGKGKGTFNVAWMWPDGTTEDPIPLERVAYPEQRRDFVSLAVDDAHSSRSETVLDHENPRIRLRNPDSVEIDEVFEILLDPRMPRLTALALIADRHTDLTAEGHGTGRGGTCEIRELTVEVVDANGEPRAVDFHEPIKNYGVGKYATDGDPKTTWSLTHRAPDRVWLVLVPKQPLAIAPTERLKVTIQNKNAVGFFVFRATNSPEAVNILTASDEQLQQVFSK